MRKAEWKSNKNPCFACNGGAFQLLPCLCLSHTEEPWLQKAQSYDAIPDKKRGAGIMTQIYLNVGRASVRVTCDDVLQKVIATCWPRAISDTPQGAVMGEVDIRTVSENRWTLHQSGQAPVGPVAKADFVGALADVIKDMLCRREDAFRVHASAAAWDGGRVLIVGPQNAGKSLLMAWLVEQGFGLEADNDMVFSTANGQLAGMGGPISLAPGQAIEILKNLGDFKTCLHLKGEANDVTLSQVEWVLPAEHTPPAVLLFVEHNTNAVFSVTAMSRDDVRAKLSNSHPHLDEAQLAALNAYFAQTPAMALTYGSFADLENTVDQLCFHAISVAPSPEVFAQYLQKLTGSAGQAKAVHPIPARTERQLSPRMTIGMATFDDYDGVYFSLQAMRLYHPEILDQVEFLVIDNNPEGACSGALKRLETNIPNYRYVPAQGIKGTAVRELIFQEAYGEYVLSMDCHVFFAPGALDRLLGYYAKNPMTNDLLQGPLLFDDLASVATHFVPDWRDGMFGYWSDSEAGFDGDAAPFEIPNQGLGIFSCRKAAWPGFNPAFRGFGGEEGYIHQKFRNRGDKALCLPFLQWVHRFERPFGVAYRNTWEDRIRNYAIGWKEVGLPLDDMKAHFTAHTNAEIVASALRQLEQETAPHALMHKKGER